MTFGTLESQEIMEAIDRCIREENYLKAAGLIEENRTYLQTHADIKSQSLLNKKYAVCLFHTLRAKYFRKKDLQFLRIFEEHRGLIEVHCSKKEYDDLLKKYRHIKKQRKHRLFGLIFLCLLILAPFLWIWVGKIPAP